jgi:mannose-1-phosphate guanylyltransferase/mannose-1-phosphate guanylyltransferase/mannose-6-phosphate isomerase
VLLSSRAAVEAGRTEGRRFLPGADAFAGAPSISIDYAVMERAERVAVVPVSMGWSDIGSWDALHEIGERDEPAIWWKARRSRSAAGIASSGPMVQPWSPLASRTSS